VNETVQDRIRDGGFADYVIPAGHGELGSDDGGVCGMAVFNDIQEVQTLVGIQGGKAEVVQD
jgi:hypothetical protein